MARCWLSGAGPQSISRPAFRPGPRALPRVASKNGCILGYLAMEVRGGTERRIQPRAPIELRVEYQRFNTFLADYTKNISRGGTFIATEKPLPEGTEFRFQLTVPKLPKPLILNGKVMWTTTAEDASRANPSGMGIEFLFDSDVDRQQIAMAVEAVIRDQFGEPLATRLLGH